MQAESFSFLDPGGKGVVVDCTVGLGGHARALLERNREITLVGLDRDEEAIATARQRLAPFADRVRLAVARFSELSRVLDELGYESVQGIFADLGVSSLQLDKAERGFSFRYRGPLDMRMGGGDLTAEHIVNTYGEVALEHILRRYGEEKQARRIARALIRARSQAAVETTEQLREIVHRAKRGGRGRDGRRIDPSTRVFQALRIEVNQELEELEQLLEQGVRRLEQGGGLVVISYHSLEDRIVKNVLRDGERGDVDPVTGRSRAETKVLEVLTRKPLRPSPEEVAENPRARSARLRAARRL
jgi:16S rRNA (cytosine1402-N4)-methyltransferase